MTNREKFEAWAKSIILSPNLLMTTSIGNEGNYQSAFIELAFKAWIEATRVEREACADICRELYYNDGITCAEYILSLIHI